MLMTVVYILLGAAFSWTVMRAWEDSEPARVALVEAKMEEDQHKLMLQHHQDVAKAQKVAKEATEARVADLEAAAA